MNSWFTKHRPHQLHELHLTSARERLLQLLKSDHFPQVLLLAGPKGTGKTSSARIIAALLNDPANADAVEQVFFGKSGKKAHELHEPAETNEVVQRILNGNSFAVQEMDAASNRGIDDVRQLKERLALPPTEGKVTVYILDEVHMLTTEAFNALLKVFEEPPAHVVFILATTELHKLPATIVSRCFVVPFQRATPTELEQALIRVLEREKIQYEAGALAPIVELADGSFRDAVKWLEQACVGQTTLTLAAVEKVVPGAQLTNQAELISAVLTKDPLRVVALISEWRAAGLTDAVALPRLCQWLHQQLLIAVGAADGTAAASAKALHFLLSELSSVTPSATSALPLLTVELKLLDIVFRAQQQASKSTPPPASPEIPKISSRPPAKVVAEAAPTSPAKVVHLSGNAQQLIEKWAEFLALVRERNSAIAGLLAAAQPAPAESGVAISVFYQFHKDQLSSPKLHTLISECVSTIAGGLVEIQYVLAPPVPASEPNLADLAKDILV